MFDLIVTVIERSGYVGIALLMFAENVFPPIPSELIMPFAGFAAARGELSLAGVAVAGSVGSLAGAVVWYAVGRALGVVRLKHWAARHGRWLTLAPEEIDRSSAWFRRRGPLAVLFGRLVPAVRTLISVPAGVAGMALAPFLLCSSIGTGAWTAVLALGGRALESRYDEIATWLDPVSSVIVAVLVALYLYRVATFRRRHDGQHEGP